MIKRLKLSIINRRHMWLFLRTIKTHPIESLLYWVLISGFLYHLTVKCPICWNPPRYLSDYSDIELFDIYTCSKNTQKDILCPKSSFNLNHKYEVVSRVDDSVLSSLATKYSISEGGYYKPSMCTPRHKVAIVIPFRNRAEQLKIFLQNIHEFLIKQQIEYQIFVVNQIDRVPFNRGKLFNVGFIESLKISGEFCCFIFHDVDLIPENVHNLYGCSKNPRHMSVAVNTFRYNLLYPDLFGGVISIRRDQFKAINGFSNLYYGWGGEDDDLSSRISSLGLKIIRWHPDISRYFMLTHKKEKPSDTRKQLLNEYKIRSKDDGLSSLQYKIHSIISDPLFTRIDVSL